MENTEEFESWLFRLIRDAKIKLSMEDSTIAYILLREGTNYYLRDISSRHLKDICNNELRNAKEHT